MFHGPEVMRVSHRFACGMRLRETFSVLLQWALHWVERNLSVQCFSVDRFSRHKNMKRCVIPGELRTLNPSKYWTAKERLTFISNEHEFQQD